MDFPSKQNVIDSTSKENVSVIHSIEKDNVNKETTPKKSKCLIPQSTFLQLQ